MNNSKFTTQSIISTVILLLLIGILLPIGLESIISYNGSYYNGTYGSGAALGVNSTIGTLLGSILPIMAVITLILVFIPKNRG